MSTAKVKGWTLGKMATLLSKSAHLVVRPAGVLCTRCFVTEPVTCGGGTPMPALVYAHALLAARHQNCKPPREVNTHG